MKVGRDARGLKRDEEARKVHPGGHRDFKHLGFIVKKGRPTSCVLY
jgi:hypothetical protein